MIIYYLVFKDRAHCQLILYVTVVMLYVVSFLYIYDINLPLVTSLHRHFASNLVAHSSKLGSVAHFEHVHVPNSVHSVTCYRISSVDKSARNTFPSGGLHCVTIKSDLGTGEMKMTDIWIVRSI